MSNDNDVKVYSESETAPCTRCNGTGKYTHKGFTATDGTVYPDEEKDCSACSGRGVFPPVSVDLILNAIIATRGKNKGSLRASMTAPWGNDDVLATRAYYVWRIARFNGGKDPTIPFAADMLIKGDPHKGYLDKVADAVAKRSFGTDLAGAARWAKAFGII